MKPNRGVYSSHSTGSLQILPQSVPQTSVGLHQMVKDMGMISKIYYSSMCDKIKIEAA